MTIHCLMHVPFEGPAAIATWARQRSHRLVTHPLYANESPPAGIAASDLIVVLGGPMGVADEDAHPFLIAEKRWLRAQIAAGRRLLGICLGAQLLAEALDAPVTANAHREIGWFPILRHRSAISRPAFAAMPERFDAFHWHGDTFALPPGAVPLGASAATANQGFAYGTGLVALQCHLEYDADAIRAMIAQCGPELAVSAAYVQSDPAVLVDHQRCATAHHLLFALLDALMEADVSDHAS